jgi:hypothetical protein
LWKTTHLPLQVARGARLPSYLETAHMSVSTVPTSRADVW